MSKPVYIIANFKSNKSISESIAWVEAVGPKLEKRDDLVVVVCPPFTDLSEVKHAVTVGHYPLQVGSQDLSPFDEGAYTGEESANLLKDVVSFAIIGHSERRQNFNETNEQVAEKVHQALSVGITPVVCVQGADTPIPDQSPIVAYEPIFAIGSGQPDTPQNANNVADQIKQSHPQTAVLYGGSVNEENLKAYLEQPMIDGCLIGGATLDPEQFLKIIEVAYSQSWQ